MTNPIPDEILQRARVVANNCTPATLTDDLIEALMAERNAALEEAATILDKAQKQWRHTAFNSDKYGERYAAGQKADAAEQLATTIRNMKVKADE